MLKTSSKLLKTFIVLLYITAMGAAYMEASKPKISEIDTDYEFSYLEYDAEGNNTVSRIKIFEKGTQGNVEEWD